ncbi:hypothetical protein [Pseudomonas helleri]|nr:hypothetical protein [Pseudomonas helleri]
MSGSQEITFQIEGDIALIGINRQDKRNAMRQDMSALTWPKRN